MLSVFSSLHESIAKDQGAATIQLHSSGCGSSLILGPSSSGVALGKGGGRTSVVD